MANLITLSRLLLLGLFLFLGLSTNSHHHWYASLLIPIMFATDALDGYVARRRHEESVFGARFDIFSDRVVELTLWTFFAFKGVAPLWALVLVSARGLLIDALRRRNMKTQACAPLHTVHSDWGRWVVGSRAVRFAYATLKGITFCWLMVCIALEGTSSTPSVTTLGNLLIVATVAACLLRGLPVCMDNLSAAGATLTRSRLHSSRR